MEASMFPGQEHVRSESQAVARAKRAGARFLFSLVVALALAGAALASGPTVLVHPFDSQDVLLGAALATEVADALDETSVVIGPEVAAAAVPPLAVEGGFINPARVVDPNDVYRPAGAD